MKRTKSLNTNASTLVRRNALAAALGVQSYSGERDLYQALGYKHTLLYEDYTSRYLRQDIAKAIIDRPIKATWQGCLDVVEPMHDETSLQNAWKELNAVHSLKSIFSRADKCAGLGKYGILLLGLDDVKKVEDFQKPVTPGTRKLVYVKPFGEGSAQIFTYETDPNNKRFGLPLMYTITSQLTEGGASVVIEVHHTRVIHIVDDILESEVEGNPRLEVVFNRLMDLEKLIGGDAEMFWRGARPGYSGAAGKDFQVTDATMEGLKEQVDEYENNLRRILITEGIDLKALDQQIADPASHVDVQIQMISAVTGIPKRVLVGTERGELSSAQDTVEWKVYVQSRREDFAELRIVRPFIDRCIEYKILPAPKTKGEYDIKWSDLFAVSEADRVKIGVDRSIAIKNYTGSLMAEAVMPPKAFLEFGLGLTKDEINIISEQIDDDVLEEIKSQDIEESQNSSQTIDSE